MIFLCGHLDRGMCMCECKGQQSKSDIQSPGARVTGCLGVA